MKRICVAVVMLSCLSGAAQQQPANAQPTAAATPDPFATLHFLEGTWEATAQSSPDAHGASAQRKGRYTFQRELDGHILARHATSDAGCKMPANFDCAHSDLLYVYQDAPGTRLKAIYFDNEGHVIHYEVTTPTPTRAIFLSSPAVTPQFRLVYDLNAGVMTGTFQMQTPGHGQWRTYLRWSGRRE